MRLRVPLLIAAAVVVAVALVAAGCGGESDARGRTCYDGDIIFLECGVDGRHRFLLRVVSAVSSGLQRCLNLSGFIHGFQVDRAASS